MPSYALFSSTEVLGRVALERMLAGLSTRRYRSGTPMRDGQLVTDPYRSGPSSADRPCS